MRSRGAGAYEPTRAEVNITVGQSIDANRQRLLELAEAKAVALPAAQSSNALPVIDCEAAEVSA
jgi:hypothetical protein